MYVNAFHFCLFVYMLLELYHFAFDMHQTGNFMEKGEPRPIVGLRLE